MTEYLTLTNENIDSSHICCAFSDKKCAKSLQQKKDWLKKEFDNGYIFKRLNERAKVFIEYGPVEKAWVPIKAENLLHIGCFWVSGKYKKQGHGKNLLTHVIKDAEESNKNGIVTIAGKKKFNFMGDTKWLLKNSFKICDSLDSGFALLYLDLTGKGEKPLFNETLKKDNFPHKKGCVAIYSNRCPYSGYHVEETLAKTCKKRNIPLKVIKLKTMEQARKAPTPATIFSLFMDGQFITTDISVCMENKFDKILKK